MTRINLIDPALLCDQHLRAEHRELPRIPNKLAQGKSRLDLSDLPAVYTVQTADNPSGGKGHERFFINKLGWLQSRYNALSVEMLRRGFKTDYRWPKCVNASSSRFAHLFNDYQPQQADKRLNFKRIVERTPKRMLMLREHKQNHYTEVNV